MSQGFQNVPENQFQDIRSFHNVKATKQMHLENADMILKNLNRDDFAVDLFFQLKNIFRTFNTAS